MARISDIIAKFINDMIEEEKDKEIIIQRNELADKFNCAPSQINYVLTTRFTTEKGYVIEVDIPNWCTMIGYQVMYEHKGYELSAGNPQIFSTW